MSKKEEKETNKLDKENIKIKILSPFVISDDRPYHNSATSWNESVGMPQNQPYLPTRYTSQCNYF